MEKPDDFKSLLGLTVEQAIHQERQRLFDAMQEEAASLEWNITNDQTKLKALLVRQQTLCGQLGHDFGDHDGYCLICGYQDDWEPDYDHEI